MAERAGSRAGEFDDEDHKILVTQPISPGHEAEEVGEAVGRDAKSVRNRLDKLRPRFRELLTAHGVLKAALLAVLLVLGFFAWKKHENEAKPRPDDVVVPQPAPAPVSTKTEDGLVKAEELRKEAFARCFQGEYAACAAKLDEAAALDPASESREDVREARESIRRWTTEPSGPLKPGRGR